MNFSFLIQTTLLSAQKHMMMRTFFSNVTAEMDMGWVDPWVGLGRVSKSGPMSTSDVTAEDIKINFGNRIITIINALFVPTETYIIIFIRGLYIHCCCSSL